MTVAAVVMAHQDPQHVRRLIERLGDVPVVLHCDAKTPRDEARAMSYGWGARVLLLPRASGRLSSWSLVRIEMDAVRAALRHFSAERVVIMSGACHPLCRPEDIGTLLEPWADRTCMVNMPIPHGGWSTRRHPDGGLWRMDRRFLVRHDQLLTFRGVPLRRPWRRPIPEGLRLRASSQWKIWSRRDAERVLAVLDERPDIVDFWRTSLIPEESFVASILSSPRISGIPAAEDNDAHPWYLRWPDGRTDHPVWLTREDEPAIVDALHRGATPEGPRTGAGQAPMRPLFMRKVSSRRSAELLDAVDHSVDART